MSHNTRISPCSQQSNSDSRAPIEPLPLFRELGAPEPYPIEALGPILGPAAQCLIDIVQAPDSLCAQSVLAAAALATQSIANISLDGRSYPLSLFFITLASSGERKSAIDRIVLDPFRRRQEALMETYRAEYSVYQLSVTQDRKKNAKAPVPNSPQPKPTRPLLLTSEPTMEGLISHFKEGYPSIGLFSDEAASFIGGYSNRDEQRMHATAVLCKLWDGDAVDRVRQAEEPTVVSGVRTSLHLLGQETLIDSIIGNPTYEGQGLLSRVLLALPQSRIGQRYYKSVNVLQDPCVMSFHEQLNKLLNLSIGGRIPKQLQLRSLTLSDDAYALWVLFHDSTEMQLRPSGAYYPLLRFGAKAPEHTLRIAGVLTLIEDPMAQIVTAHSIKAAMTLTSWYLKETARIQSATSLREDLKKAQKLLEWLQNREHSTIWLGDIYRNGPTMFRRAQEARTAMLTLQDHGWVRPLEGIQKVDGVLRQGHRLLNLNRADGQMFWIA